MSLPRQKSEYRKDPLSNSWVIISSERSGRPEEFREIATQRIAAPCPFCIGNENETPAEIATYRSEHSTAPRWQVRVVPNKFPAVVRSESAFVAAAPSIFAETNGNLFTAVAGHGQHEVIIESPTHAVSLTDLPPEIIELTFLAYRDRIRAFRDEGKWRYVQVFKNVGAAAGSSIEHAHSQVVAMPIVPVRVADELAATQAYYQTHERRLFTDLVEQELAAGVRIIQESAEFVALCPFASRFPFETWIVPRHPLSHFEQSSESLVRQLAHFTADILRRLEHVLNRVAYNYLIHTAPFDHHDSHYQWHLELFPRLTKFAGFEWGTGYSINPVSPEQAAKILRQGEEK
jgi:UDPglucose--hexose-1-phosphate uridylyltransferase